LLLSLGEVGGAAHGSQQNQGKSVTFPLQQLQLPSGPGSARSLFDQIVNKINQGHRLQQQKPNQIPQQAPQQPNGFQLQQQVGSQTVQLAPQQPTGLPQPQPLKIQRIQKIPSISELYPKPEAKNIGVSSLANVGQLPTTTLPQLPQELKPSLPPMSNRFEIPEPHQSVAVKIPNGFEIFNAVNVNTEPMIRHQDPPLPSFTLDLSKDLPVAKVILNEPEPNTTPRSIYHALEAQLKEQRALEEYVNKKRLEEIEIMRNRKLKEIELLKERKRQEELTKTKFHLQEHRELEGIYHKDFFRIANKQIMLDDHLDERTRFSIHKSIANSFGRPLVVKKIPDKKVVVGLATSKNGRFQERPEPV